MNGRIVEGALNESDQLLENFLRTSPNGIAVLSRDLRFLALNDALAKINGIPIHEHLGRLIRDVVGDDLATVVEPVLTRVLATGEVVSNLDVTAKLPTRNHKGDWTVTYFPIKDSCGVVSRVGAIVTETTKQKRLKGCLADLAENLPRIRDQVLCVGLRERSEADRTESWVGSMHLLEHCVQLLRDCAGLLGTGERQSNMSTVEALGQTVLAFTPKEQVNLSNGGNGLATLSPRLVETIRLLALGKTNKEIAAVMGISLKTVETYRERSMLKLNLHSTTDLVHYAISKNLIRPSTFPTGYFPTESTDLQR